MPLSSSTRSALRPTLFAIALCASLSAYAKDTAPQPPIPGDWPDFLKKAMKNETRIKGSTPLDLADSGIEVTTPGQLASAPEKTENAWYFSTTLDKEHVIECWLFDSEVGLASTVKNMHTLLIDRAAKNMDKPVRKSPYYVHSDAVDGALLMTSEWFLLLGDESPVAGLSKVRIAQKDGRTTMCSAFGLGNRKTFARYFDDLLASMTVVNEITPYYGETYRLSVSERKAGVGAMTFKLLSDGTTLATLTTSMLLQIDANSNLASDSVHVSFSNPDGTLLRAYESVTENGTLRTDLSLEKNDDDVWHVNGAFNGKDIDLNVDSDKTPITPLGQMILARDAIAAKNKASIPFPFWVPQADPSTFVSGTFQVEKLSRRGNKAVITTGPITMNAVLDKNGSATEVTIAAGPSTIFMERVSVSGQIPASANE